ncbi:MAG: TrbG/VirB9 family P-type conjugative transfer protein [Rhodospirillales bacterium]|nr:TrbG/VirB9 family P-type conjugative transfer protein [Rhodospirillales bacterium]
MFAAKPVLSVIVLCAIAAINPVHAAKASDIIDLTGKKPSQSHSQQIDEQRRGEFGRLPRDTTPAGQIQKAWDSAPENAGVTAVNFSPSHSYRLVTRTMMVTTIELQKSESIIGVDVPDATYFNVEIRPPNKVGIIPSLAGLDMTIAIHTESGRTYPVYVRSTDWNAKEIPDLLLRINLPGEFVKIEPPALPEKNDPDADEGEHSDAKGNERPDYLSKVSFDPSTIAGFESVRMWGDKEIAPVVAWHDDRFSYFHYGEKFATVDLPVVHRVRDDIDSPTNTRVAGTTLIAEEIAPLFTLQVGQKVVCVHFTDIGPAPKKVSTKTAQNKQLTDTDWRDFDRFNEPSVR